ncbi:5-formyltetrahydrofolate cyclo-ligase [bacterium]|nr:5-formyltetrahydrofolate cyclo-ligase [bacterium]
MTTDEVESKSRETIERFVDLPEYGQSSCIMLYWSCHNEVHTHDLVRSAIEKGKRVLLPRCDTQRRQIYPHRVTDLSRDLEVGPFGILQPRENAPELFDLEEIEVCVVPGIAFDRQGNRVGRGLGYYDRFLRRLDEKIKRIGVGYAFQIVDKIYPTDGDASLDKIVTEKKTLVAPRR